MAEEDLQASPLLNLPDPCLLAVLQCLAEDPASMCSAARAHSRLHQVAVGELHSIRADIRTQQQLDDSLMLYLDSYGQHVSSMHLAGCCSGSDCQLRLLQLPPSLQLTNLSLHQAGLQLQPGQVFEGVLGAAGLPLKRLQLSSCTLFDGVKALTAALSLLPGLEHLSVCNVDFAESSPYDPFHGCIPTAVLRQLPQLTYLELIGIRLGHSPRQHSSEQTPLQSLTRLVELQLQPTDDCSISANTLSGLCRLTRLVLSCALGPGALACQTQLQHLDLTRCRISGRSYEAGIAQLLPEMQHLQQLTHLQLAGSLQSTPPLLLGNPFAAAFSALTASSKLHSLDISSCSLPAGAWQHIFPTGQVPQLRQLPHLRELNIGFVRDPSGDHAAAPGGSGLASCCPGLQLLRMVGLLCDAEQLAPLTSLTGLHTLHLTVPDESCQEVTQCLCGLTGLRELELFGPSNFEAEGLLLQLTRLQQLTHLHLFCNAISYQYRFSRKDPRVTRPSDEPVWRQLLQHHVDHSKPEAAQQATAALASLML